MFFSRARILQRGIQLDFGNTPRVFIVALASKIQWPSWQENRDSPKQQRIPPLLFCEGMILLRIRLFRYAGVVEW